MAIEVVKEMPLELQKHAVHYAVCFLGDSITELKEVLKAGIMSPVVERELRNRLKHYEDESKKLNEWNDKFSS